MSPSIEPACRHLGTLAKWDLVEILTGGKNTGNQYHRDVFEESESS